MPRFLEAEQGTQEWFDYRAGHATASRFRDILAGKGAREAYMWELVGERLAGSSLRNNTSKSLEWGTNSEPLAREEYRIRTGELTRKVGFAVHSRIKWLGASSDDLVGEHGCIEIKSPFNSGIHTRTLALGMPEDHLPQTQGNLLVLERKWIDFCSYDAAFEPPYNLYIQRLEREEKYIKMLEGEIKKFLAEVSVAVRDLQQKYIH